MKGQLVLEVEHFKLQAVMHFNNCLHNSDELVLAILLSITAVH